MISGLFKYVSILISTYFAGILLYELLGYFDLTISNWIWWVGAFFVAGIIDHVFYEFASEGFSMVFGALCFILFGAASLGTVEEHINKANEFVELVNLIKEHQLEDQQTANSNSNSVISYDTPMNILVEGKADIYSGPGDNYKSVGQGIAGNSVLAIGKVKGKDWFKVTMKDGSGGYIRIDFPQKKMPLAQVGEKQLTEPTMSGLKFVLTHTSGNLNGYMYYEVFNKKNFEGESNYRYDRRQKSSLELIVKDDHMLNRGTHSFRVQTDSNQSPSIEGLIMKVFKNGKLLETYSGRKDRVKTIDGWTAYIWEQNFEL